MKLKTTLILHNTPEAHALVELLSVIIPAASLHAAVAEGLYRLHIDINAPATEVQQRLMLDVLRTLEPLLYETVYLEGSLGDQTMQGYLGPDKREKEKSRARLERIQRELAHLLPEHRAELSTLLSA